MHRQISIFISHTCTRWVREEQGLDQHWFDEGGCKMQWKTST